MKGEGVTLSVYPIQGIHISRQAIDETDELLGQKSESEVLFYAQSAFLSLLLRCHS